MMSNAFWIRHLRYLFPNDVSNVELSNSYQIYDESFIWTGFVIERKNWLTEKLVQTYDNLKTEYVLLNPIVCLQNPEMA